MEHGQAKGDGLGDGIVDLGALGSAPEADTGEVEDHGGMGGLRTATESESAEIEAADVKEHSTFGADIVGADEGAERVLCHMILDPRLPPNRAKIKGLTKEQIRDQIAEALRDHCAKIGWWPDGEGPDFVVNQRTDGVWHGWAKLAASNKNHAKDWDSFPRFKVDGRTADDVAKNRTTTHMGS